jgi:3-phosphoshikimate 1-carboxyvinyltransferase
MSLIIENAGRIMGTLRVPGDKSISHRALILGAMARGKQVVQGLPHAADVGSTIRCLQSLGCLIEEMPDGRTLILPRPFSSGRSLDCGNSGTTARLLAGLIAGSSIEATLDGDNSLRRRPMERIAAPLRKMGAGISSAPGGLLPMIVTGGKLEGITYRLPVPSAQVKSAILIAGLSAEGNTVVEEPVPCRDHTERMLAAMAAPIHREKDRITIEGGSQLRATEVKVPGDISSAAFFIVAALCLPHSEIYLPSTGLNPTRTGLIDTLNRMGAAIEKVNEELFLEEPVADLVVQSRSLSAVTVEGGLIPALIDELPILAVAATQAHGETIVRGAEELRHKESDRIAAIVRNLSDLGTDIEEHDDGFTVRGPCRLKGAHVNSFGDHRIAMAMAIAGLLAEGHTHIEGDDCVAVSYPGFMRDLNALLH